jgi:hypothetical protein
MPGAVAGRKNMWFRNDKSMARPERLLGLTPSSLRDRRRWRSGVQLRQTAKLSNSPCCLPVVRIESVEQHLAVLRFSIRNSVARPERFELPASWFVVAKMI